MGMRWDPFRDAMSLREAMDRLLEQSVISPRGGTATGRGAQTLPIDLWETADSLVVRVPLPGVKPENDDVDISVDGNVLTIRARLPDAAGEGGEASAGASGQASATGPDQRVRWLVREIPRGEAQRSVELPVAVDADKATAHFGNGLLLLTLPKAQAARPRRINVTSA
jgi:HSP20 family protein